MKASVIERGSALNKTLSVLMALALAVSLAPLPAYAETPGEPMQGQGQQLDPAPETQAEPDAAEVPAESVEAEGAPVIGAVAEPATLPSESAAETPAELAGGDFNSSADSPSDATATASQQLADSNLGLEASEQRELAEFQYSWTGVKDNGVMVMVDFEAKGREDEMPAGFSDSPISQIQGDAAAVRALLEAKYDGVTSSTVQGVYDISLRDVDGVPQVLPDSATIGRIGFLAMDLNGGLGDAPSLFRVEGGELIDCSSSAIEASSQMWGFNVTRSPQLGTYALIDMTGLTEKAPAPKVLEPGYYTADVNVYVPADQAPIGMKVYVTDVNMPPLSYQRQNGTIWVKEDGTVEVTIYVRQGIFWVEDITSGENVEVLDLKYEDTGVTWGDYSKRITEVVAKVSEPATLGVKEYKFGTCTEYPTVLQTVQHWDLYLQIDYDSAVEGAFNPNVGETWSHVYENAEAGTTLSVTTGEAELGEKLGSLHFDGGVTDDAQVREDALALFDATWNGSPEYVVYDFSLKDGAGNPVDMGDAAMSASFPVRDGIKGTHAYQYEGGALAEAPFISSNQATGVLVNAKAGPLVCAFEKEAEDVFGNEQTAPWYVLSATDEATSAVVTGYSPGVDGRLTYANPEQFEMRMRSETVGGRTAYDFVYWSTEARLRTFFQSEIDAMIAAYREEDPALTEAQANEKALLSLREELSEQIGLFLGKFTFTVPADSAGDRVVMVVDDGEKKLIYPLTQEYADGAITATYLNGNYADTCLGWDNSLMKQAYAHGAQSGTAGAPAAYLMVIPADEKVALEPANMPSTSRRVYTGKPIQGMRVDSTCDVVDGVVEATDAGTYSVTVKPKDGYTWIDGASDERTASWRIFRAQLTVTYDKGVKANPTQADLPTADEVTAGMVVTGFVNGETPETAKDYVAPAADASKITVELFNAPGPNGRETNGLFLTSIRDRKKGSAANYSFVYSGKLWKAIPDEAMPVSDDALMYSGKAQEGITINPTTSETTTIGVGGSTVIVVNKYLQLASGSVEATEAGTYTVTVEPSLRCWPDGSLEPREFTYAIAPAELTATYAGEEVEAGEAPALAVSVEGFVNGETAETAAGYVAPTVALPGELKAGTSYELAPSNGQARNYAFTYVPGRLSVKAAPAPAADERVKPGTYTVTANVWLNATDADNAGFPVLKGIVGADGGAYMTNATNPLGAEGAASGVPTSPVSGNATLVVADDGTCTLTVPIVNPVFTMQKLGSNASLGNMSYTTKAGGYGNYASRIDSITVTLPSAEDATYVLDGSAFHPTILAAQYPAAITVPLRLTVDGLGALPKQNAASGETGGNTAPGDDNAGSGNDGGTATAGNGGGTAAAGAGTGAGTGAGAGTVQTTSDGRLAAGTYTVSANIWVNKETSGLPLQPHFTSAAFPPMNPVAGNATLRVDGDGRAYLTVPIVIQSRVMQVRSISGLPIVDYSSSDGGLTSITLDLGVLSASDTVVTRSCTASVHLGDLAASIIGGERDRTWAATFQMNFTGLPSSGGGEVPAAVQAMIDAAGSDGRAADADAAAAAAKASALGGLTKNLRPQRAYADEGSAESPDPVQQEDFPWALVVGGAAVVAVVGAAAYLLGPRRKRDMRQVR